MSAKGFYQSSLTKKYIMAFAGLFLITFLFVHLTINLLLLCPGNESYAARQLFNISAHFMASNPVIKIFEVVLFGGIIIHMIYGLILQLQNWGARPIRYAVEGWSHKSPFSKFMIHTAVIILTFLVIHLIDFYFKVKFFEGAESVIYSGKEYHDMGALIIQKFNIPGFVIGYIVAFIILGFHLHHGFQSAFQSLGLNHSKYTPLIKALSLLVSFVLPLGFTIIPLAIFFGYVTL